MATVFTKFSRFCGSRALAALIAVNTAVFLLLWGVILIGNSMGIEGNFTMTWMGMSGSWNLFIRHPWTLLTYMVTQYGFMHLLFNMLWLFWFGRILTVTLSDRHLLWAYVGGGVTGGLLFLAVQAFAGGTPDYLCGSSASVIAVMTAAAVRTPDMRLYLFLFGEVKLKWVALVCIVLAFTGAGGGQSGGAVVHLAGVVFGAAFALALRKGFDPTKSFAKAVQSGRGATASRWKVPVKRDGEAVARAASGRLSDESRLDSLLDKIRLSGYSSLTTAERNELTALSNRLKNGN